jgi:hypothetical protein
MPYKDKEASRARQRTYYAANREKHKAYQYKWDTKNKEKVTAYRAAWVKADRLANPEKWQRREFEQSLRKRFGTTPEWYEAKFKEQSGVCAICRRPETSINAVNGRTMRLAVDHAHHGKKRNRGLLCNTCNGALARLEAIEGWAEKALAYLKQYE